MSFQFNDQRLPAHDFGRSRLVVKSFADSRLITPRDTRIYDVAKADPMIPSETTVSKKIYSAGERALPTLHERPDRDVVIFDGNCAFCRSQVERLNRWDRRRRLAFVSLHDPIVAERFPDLSHEELMQQMYIVDRRGNRHGGAAAFRYLSRHLRILWPVAPLMHIPFTLPLWQWGYRLVAKRRYRIRNQDECRNGACKVHFK
jgi:predicted DCC family thiol-disulfide oxidoreductase YuxK